MNDSGIREMGDDGHGQGPDGADQRKNEVYMETGREWVR